MRTVGRCRAFRSCRRRAKYDSPACLCSKHWRMWFLYNSYERLPYMIAIDDALADLAACP